jgi:hypothetical protein
MIDDIFSILMEQKLVDWEVIRQGLMDVPGLADVLSPTCVATFSMTRLELVEPTSPYLKQIVAMATEPNLSTHELLTMVNQISFRTTAGQIHGCRCWRFGILAETAS